ncbi:hypothetical protein [Fulvivirga ligni]|uniref:hypothetical protein n=1 Tax=Fulvivirga ligni TaxID=2904246 RepID=UPI001F272392|nr:hypothetical protein [Fulvivirga ligni]UII19123.1 hypothetical protein LVD16_14860 [Fulvivirga ligni]
MRKLNLFVGAMLLAIVGTFTACQDQDLSQNQQGPIALKNDVLVFKTQADFESTLTYLKENQDALGEWEKKFPGFVSLRSAYVKFEDALNNTNSEADVEELMEANKSIFTTTDRSGELELVPLMDDDLISTVFNKDGLIVVAGKLMKVTDKQLFEQELVSDADFKVSLQDFQQSILSGGAKNTPVVKTIVNFDVKTGKRIDTCDKTYDGGKKRLKGEIFRNMVGPLYSSVGARSKHQKKRLGLWTADKTDKIRLKIDGEYFQEALGGVVILPITYDKTESDENKISKTFEFCVLVECEFGINYMENLHWCDCDDSNQRSCITSI